MALRRAACCSAPGTRCTRPRSPAWASARTSPARHRPRRARSRTSSGCMRDGGPARRGARRPQLRRDGGDRRRRARGRSASSAWSISTPSFPRTASARSTTSCPSAPRDSARRASAAASSTRRRCRCGAWRNPEHVAFARQRETRHPYRTLHASACGVVNSSAAALPKTFIYCSSPATGTFDQFAAKYRERPALALPRAQDRATTRMILVPGERRGDTAAVGARIR